MRAREGLVVYWPDRRCNVRVSAIGLRCVFLVPTVPGAINGRVVVATVTEFERNARPTQLALAFG